MAGCIFVSAGSTNVVAGMEWTSLNTKHADKAKSDLRAASQNVGSKYGVTTSTPSGRKYVGFVPPSAPKKARSSYSAAILLANATQTPVLFIKALARDEFWIVSAKQPGEIDIRADQIAHSSMAAQICDMILNDVPSSDGARGRFRIVIEGDRYPESMMMDRGDFTRESGTFADLVRGRPPGKEERIQKLLGVKPGQVIALGAVAGTIGVGYYAYQSYEQSLRDAEIAAQQAELQRQHLTAQQIKTETDLRITKAVIAAAHEDTATPPADVVIRTCLSTLRRVGAEIAGWKLTQAQCSPQGTAVDLSYQLLEDNKTAGTNATLSHEATAKLGVVPSIVLGADRASLQIPLPAPENRSGLTPPQLPHYADVVEKFGTRFQMLHEAMQSIRISITPPQPRAITYIDPAKEHSQDANKTAQVPVERGYSRGTIQISGTNLWQLEVFSLSYPFLSIKKIEATPTGDDDDTYQWRVEGDYVSSRS